MFDELIFKGDAHKARFLTAVQKLGKVYNSKIDSEYGAAIYVLTADAGIWNEVQDYVERDQIAFKKILQDFYLSTGERILIQWAANLFNEFAADINPVELMRLDESNFEIAICALRIRRDGLRVNIPNERTDHHE